jgi:hypothetical protein
MVIVKKPVYILYIILISVIGLLVSVVVNNGFAPIILSGKAASEEEVCFKTSFKQVNETMLAAIDTSMIAQGVDGDPLLMLMFLIKEFSGFDETGDDRCVPIKEIYLSRRSNRKSSCLAVSAIMQKKGWNVRYYFNDNEEYLGLPLEEGWQIRKGNWIPQDGVLYYLKEFNLMTPIGTILKDDPAAKYQTVPLARTDIRTIPLIKKLPYFKPDYVGLVLKWQYRQSVYEIVVMIPQEQIDWTRILPSSFYGIGYSGILELRNMHLPEKLQPIIDTMSEYNKVNCLYKFSQSESIFTYRTEESIKSISIQLNEARNDCDSRSVFLYALLRAVLDYSDPEIFFVNWENHVALALKPRSRETVDSLKSVDAFEVDSGFYLLDPAYGGASYWGAKMPRLGNKFEVIRFGEK